MKNNRPGFNKWIDKIYRESKRIRKKYQNTSEDSRSEFNKPLNL